MECEHGTAGMAACAMSCCHETQQTLVGPVVFVLQPAVELLGLSSVARASEHPATKDILQNRKPLSPPPRLLITA
jgi:hypothetical protein